MGCTNSTLQPSSTGVNKTVIPHRNTASSEDVDFLHGNNKNDDNLTMEHLPHLLGHPSAALHGYALGCEVQNYPSLMKLYVGLAKLTYESKVLKVYQRQPAVAGVDATKLDQMMVQEVNFLRRLQEPTTVIPASGKHQSPSVNVYKAFLALEDVYLTKNEAFLVSYPCVFFETEFQMTN